MAPRSRRPVRHKFQMHVPQGIVIRPENAVIKVGSSHQPFRLLAELGAAIKQVREEPDFVWEFPMTKAETNSPSDRVHVPMVHASCVSHILPIRIQSFTPSREIEIADLAFEEIECVVCNERMLDDQLPVYQCRNNRHFVCETCVLNMDATSAAACYENVKDKCPICRHEDTFFVVKNWHTQVDRLREECPFGCAERFFAPEEEAHFVECTGIISK